MKRLTLAVIALLMLGAASYARSGDTLTLKVGKEAKGKTSKVRVKFLSVVEDSRCPTDVNCIWAGNAKIKLRVSTGRTSHNAEINTNTGIRGIQIDGWAINLISLTPVPTSKGPVSAASYRATLTITRLQR